MVDKKACSHCGPKPVSEFGKNKRMPDGLCWLCKVCARAYAKLWRESLPKWALQQRRQTQRRYSEDWYQRVKADPVKYREYLDRCAARKNRKRLEDNDYAREYSRKQKKIG